jgi:LuxR family maltose regulon positive regulatory protein
MEKICLPLLTTKLYIPPQRPNLVFRPRLTARLEEALRLQHRLTLVSAKAGMGKTTLVSEWLHEQDRPATWLSLDANDDDPRRFTGYLVAALQRVDPKIGGGIPARLEMPQLPAAEALIGELINDLATASDPFLLALDDYHLIQSEWIHEAVGFLAENQPPAMHLILATRADPPLPIARLRGRGQLSEIRDHDLRFTPGEAAQFLNEAMKLDLDAEIIATLERRTEGWIAGLQMAAISMRGRQQEGDLSAFVEAFGGTNRYILDYLLEEVLNQQAPAIQEFLIETSILARMCGALCDAVRLSEAEAQGVLAHLERANLFVTPLDDERRWYRYHHLFADLLKSTLRQRRSAEDIRELHRRASRWQKDHGTLEEAITHAMAAQDYDRAASIIDENIATMLSRSEAPTLLGWIDKLPEEIVRGRPWIDVNRAYTLALSGRLEQLEPLLAGAEVRIEPGDPRARELRANIAAIRAYAANLQGDAARAMEMAVLTEELLPGQHLNAHGMAAYALAETCFAGDDIDGAIQASRRMLEVGTALDRLLIAVTALCDLASAKKVQGQLRQAGEYYGQARQWMVEKRGLDSRVRSAYQAGLADLKLQCSELDAAHEHATTAIEFCRRFGVPSEMVSAYLTRMRVLQARGDTEGALEALRHAEEIMASHHIRLAAKIALQTARVAQWLAAGDVETASRWAQALSGGSELEQMALARMWLAQGRAADAQHLLGRQLALAESGGRTARSIQMLGLLALALEAQGRLEEADASLSRALALGRPERHLRLFLDLGQPLHALLERAAAQDAAATPVARDYVQALAHAFQDERAVQRSREAAVSQPPSPADALVDPLTGRELEVLGLLAEGLSNKEIASRLVVAPSTVKQHLKHIYNKLDVHSRTQAVARGRDLGLL